MPGWRLQAPCWPHVCDGFGSVVTPTPSPTPSPTPPTSSDRDVLNFALNLEISRAQFYSFAANGTSVDRPCSPAGTPGARAPSGRASVTFTDPAVGRCLNRGDEQAHVAFLRSVLEQLCGEAQPALDLRT